MLLGATDLFKTLMDFFTGNVTKLEAHYYLIIILSLLALGIVISLVTAGRSYEARLLRCIGRFNRYFKEKPYINDDNLIEFNNKMKTAPSTVRISWQQYMLNREESPSTYINTETCVERPLKTSSIDKSIQNMTAFSVVLGIISVAVMFFYFAAQSANTTITPYIASIICITPVFIGLLYFIYVLLFRAWRNKMQSILYETFHNFQRNVNKAVTTLPYFVDYEILFTRNEIRKHIPILQDYLDKRAMQEQEELEKARLSTMETEKFNFEDLGISGSLVLERAMKECEMYLTARRRLQTECDQIETEKENYKKNFDISTKEYQRKIQASRENLESLKAQQEASTNRIESNYIKKQQADEMKKQELIEKENDEATTKFQEEQEQLTEEIKKRKEDIEEKKQAVERAMKSEFKNYANVVYGELEALVKQDIKDKIAKLTSENEELKRTLSSYQNSTDNAENMIAEQTEYQEPDIEIEEDTSSDADFAQPSDFTPSNTDDIEVEFETPVEKPFVEVEDESQESVAAEAAPAEATEDTTKNDSYKSDYSDYSAVKSGVVTEDELEELQRRIEEENNRLHQHKQEFEKEIEDKLDAMDVKEAAPAPKAAPKPRAKRQSQASNAPKTRKTRASSKTATSAKKTTKKASTATKSTKTASKPATKSAPAKKPATKVKKTTDDDVTDISAELENLMKSISKK